MNFNIGEWIVEALKLLKEHKVLRNMVYVALGVWFSISGLPPLLQSLAKLIEVIK